MAINSRDRRASCVSLVGPNLGRVWPNPDGSLGALADRQHVGWLYRGILATVPGAIAWFSGLTTSMRLTGAGQG